MSFVYRKEEIDFREEVRDFVSSQLPKDIAARVRAMTHLPKEDYVTWHGILHRRGWSAPGWPKEYGGAGWTPIQRYIFEDEAAAADAPALHTFGLNLVGPVIYTFGTPEQKAFYLPRILSMEDFWCQGYSEPGAGSDLASLSTRAECVGGHYIVNGNKIWTSGSHRADRMFCLVRTDSSASRKQEGISFLLIDMETPGIAITPIISIDRGHDLNEVFFENVKVPVENLIGEENKGWTYAKFLLEHERFGIVEIGSNKRRLSRLKEIAQNTRASGRALADDSLFRRKLAGLEIEMLSFEFMFLRGLSAEAAGRDVTQEASILKIRFTEIQQALTELAVEALGYLGLAYDQRGHSYQSPYAPAYAEGRMEDFLYRRAASIYGGTNEIQRNIIAKLILR